MVLRKCGVHGSHPYCFLLFFISKLGKITVNRRTGESLYIGQKPTRSTQPNIVVARKLFSFPPAATFSSQISGREKHIHVCVRSMFFAHSKDSATPYYNLLGILKFEDVYKLKVALFTHKILYGSTNISTIFHRSLTRASEIHTYNTRFASKLNFHRPKANNNYGTSTFAFVSSQLWETIPTNIKRLPYTSFCNQCKLYLLNMQSSEQPVY